MRDAAFVGDVGGCVWKAWWSSGADVSLVLENDSHGNSLLPSKVCRSQHHKRMSFHDSYSAMQIPRHDESSEANPLQSLPFALALTLLNSKPANIDITTYISHLRRSIPSNSTSLSYSEDGPPPSTTYYRSLLTTTESQIANLNSEVEVLKAEKSTKDKNGVGGWKKGTKCERNWGARMREVEEERKSLGGLNALGSTGARLMWTLKRLAFVEEGGIVPALEEAREALGIVFETLLTSKQPLKGGKQDSDKILRALEILWERTIHCYSTIEASSISNTASRGIYVVTGIFNAFLDGITNISTEIYRVFDEPISCPDIRMELMSLLIVTTTKLRPGFSHERSLLEAFLHALLLRLGGILVIPKVPTSNSEDGTEASFELLDILSAKDTSWYYVHILRGMWAVYGRYLASTNEDGAAQYIKQAKERLLQMAWEVAKDGKEMFVCHWAVAEVESIFGWDAVALAVGELGGAHCTGMAGTGGGEDDDGEETS